MSKELNIPPFYVGQRVVSLVDGVKGIIKKGDIVIVKKLQLCCGEWRIDIGQPLGSEYSAQVCDKCLRVLSIINTVPLARYFAPIQENFQSISLEKILEEETKLISVN